MTAINLFSQKSTSKNSSNVRPMVIRRDAKQVIGLLELVFKQHIRGSGHHAISAGFSLQDFLSGKSQTVPGFVYTINHRIVGNVSILESRRKGRYLVANVAVHPDYRRRGIARAMMNEVVEYIKSRGGRQVVLQVEHNNESAINLYKKLNFKAMGTLNDWRMNWYALKTVATRLPVNSRKPDHYDQFKIRPLRSHDAQDALTLDYFVYDRSLNWPDAPTQNYYKSDTASFVRRFLSGISNEIWIAESEHKQLVGIGIIENEVGRPYNLKLRIAPDWVQLVERPLMAKLTRRLGYLRSKTIISQQDIKQTSAEHLYREAGFSLKRSLTVMQLDL
ncbi:MAG: N-acetyltransferase [Chloroflexota bacterium]